MEVNNETIISRSRCLQDCHNVSKDKGYRIICYICICFHTGHADSVLEYAKRDPYGASTFHEIEDLETEFGDDDTEMKLASYRIGTSSEILIHYDAMDADVCESIKYTLKLIPNVNVPRTRKEGMLEDISSSNSADGVKNVGKKFRPNRRSKTIMKVKKENKIFSGHGAVSETRKKRKDFKEEEVQAGDVFSLQDTNLQMDMSIEVSGAADFATQVKAYSVSGFFTCSVKFRNNCILNIIDTITLSWVWSPVSFLFANPYAFRDIFPAFKCT